MKKPNRADDREGYELVCVEMFNADSHTYINHEYMTHEGTLIQRRGNTIRFYRPIKKSWSGDGLPPVGTVCEVASDDLKRWYECLILAHHNGKAVMFCEGWTCDDRDRDMDYDAYPAKRFRPIRTQAQIEAEEREATIKTMLALISHDYGHLKYIRDAVEQLYDAGLRMPGESK